MKNFYNNRHELQELQKLKKESKKYTFLAFLSQIVWNVISPAALRKVLTKVTGFRIIAIWNWNLLISTETFTKYN